MKKLFLLTSLLTVGAVPLQALQQPAQQGSSKVRSSWSLYAPWAVAGVLAAGGLGYAAYRQHAAVSAKPQLQSVVPNKFQSKFQSIFTYSHFVPLTVTDCVNRYKGLFERVDTQKDLESIIGDARKYAFKRVETSTAKVEFPNHQLPTDIKIIVDNNASDMNRYFDQTYLYEPLKFSHIKIFSWLPDYVVKRPALPGEHRIQGSEFCRYIIERYRQHFSLLEVPRKYHYVANGRRYVIAQKVEGTYEPNSKNEVSRRKFNLEQTMQLACFTRMAGASDMRRENAAVRDNGNASITDTDLGTFGEIESHTVTKNLITLLSDKLRSDGGLHDDARQLLQELIRYENSKKPDSDKITEKELCSIFAQRNNEENSTDILHIPQTAT